MRCAKGLRVLADATWEQVGRLDVLVYPGGIGTRRNSAWRPSVSGCVRWRPPER